MKKKPATQPPLEANEIAKDLPTLVPQPNGRGALLSGGIPGHAGGSGRPPSEVRKAARLAFDERLPSLAAIADTAERDSDRIRAIEALGHFGFGKELSAAVIRERLTRTIEIIREELGDDAEGVIAQIRAVWI
jgi:hypothetical protein